MNNLVRRAWIPALLWLGVIAAESFAGSSDHTRTLLRPILNFLFGPLSPARFEYIHSLLRKCGHFFGYAMMSLTLYRGWWATLAPPTGDKHRISWRAMLRAWDVRAAVLALLGTLIVAGLDEFHQSFNPARGSSVRDVILDELGGWLAQLLLLTISSWSPPSRIEGRKSKRETVTSS
jgi:VanZ family protein